MIAQAGDIGLFTAKNWYGSVISWVTGSPWCHAALCLGGNLWLEVSPPRARGVYFAREYADREWRVIRPDGALCAGLATASRADQFMGQPYPELKLLGYAARRPRGWIGYLGQNLVCSGVVAVAWAEAGHLHWRDDGGNILNPYTDVSPADIAAQGIREGWKIVGESSDAPQI